MVNGRFVTYKWPSWLRQQTSKQRIIWGYKILFLDVLFPLNVSKVIYVDSDQTVRGDLAELWNMDLKGKPYAYTPFCSSRKETLGYQFWRTGYWKDHLRGRPYHISALYVVDLARFRRQAVRTILFLVLSAMATHPLHQHSPRRLMPAACVWGACVVCLPRPPGGRPAAGTLR